MPPKHKKLFNPFPKYLQLREVIRRRMATEYEVGGRLPTELAFCKEFGVSRETVREALRELEADGLIVRRRAQGTFLLKRPPETADQRLTGMTEDYSALNLDTYARVLEARAVSAPIEAAQMRRPDDLLFFISRLRYFEGSPLSLHHAFLPLDVGAALSRLDLSRTSMVREVEHTLNIECFEERARIEATVADDDLAGQLALERGAPILLLSRYFVRRDRTPLILFRTYYRADRYYYTLNMSDHKSGSGFALHRA